MTKSVTKYYWWCQLGGWGCVGVYFIFLSSTLDQSITMKLIGRLLIIMFCGILTTHLFREVIRRTNWLMLPVEKVLPRLLIGVTTICILASFLRIELIGLFDLSENKHKLTFFSKLLG